MLKQNMKHMFSYIHAITDATDATDEEVKYLMTVNAEASASREKKLLFFYTR